MHGPNGLNLLGANRALFYKPNLDLKQAHRPQLSAATTAIPKRRLPSSSFPSSYTPHTSTTDDHHHVARHCLLLA